MICARCQTSNSETARFCRVCGEALLKTQAATAISAQRPASGGLIGYVIDGKYRIDAPLGAGGMGQVYSATRLHIGDTVAVKMLQPQLAGDHQMLERFRREAQAAARLKHPNVVTIHDFGRTPEGWLYQVMELVEGRSLRALLNQHGPLSPAMAVEIATQICAALDEAHSRKIVHRDLKPDNIIVAQTTRGLSVKTLDFGVARWRDLASGTGALTATGAVIGTPMYMSPEQCLGQEVDGRADIYSLGVMLYEMLSGALPFNPPTPAAFIAHHVHQPPLPLRSVNRQAPAAVEAVVMRALEKNPETRPQTAGEFARQLMNALNAGAISAPTRRDSGSSSLPGRDPTPTPFAEETAAERLPRNQAVGTAGGASAVDLEAAASHTRAARPGRTPWSFVFWLALAGGGFALWQWLNLNRQPASQELVAQSLTATSRPPLDLSRTSLADALAQAEADYREGRFGDVVATCRGILGAAPDQPRANALLGQSLFNAGNSECLGYLTRALASGATITLPVKHHHYEGPLKIDDGFCGGEMILNRNEWRFQSNDDGSHSFGITPRGVIELRNQANKSGRLLTKLALPQGGMEVKRTYNFYPAVATLQQSRLRIALRCDIPACQAMGDALYQTLRQFQQ